MAICVGCGIADVVTGEYDKDNRVEDDGTYSDGKFVCTECYTKLIDLRNGEFKPDIGNATEVQKRAKELLQ